MIAADDAALRCDFMEFYHVFDYRALPARQAALFACGLPERSRIIRKLAGVAAPTETILLAIIADALRILIWQNTEDGHKGRKPPKLITASLSDKKDREKIGFESFEEFDAWRASMMGGDCDG